MSDFSILCLNGGGILGALQVGALTEFSKTIGNPDLYTVFLDGVYGVSIGSLICTLIAFKFSITEIVELSETLLNLDNILEPPRLESILGLNKRQGLDTGSNIYKCLKSILGAKGLDIDTLKIGDAAIPLYIVASDISRCKHVIFNEEVLVWDAIRASISIPLIFTPHIIKGRVFVDGAILCKNVFRLVPVGQRNKVLVLFCSNLNTTNIEKASATTLMSHIFNASYLVEHRWLKTNFPKNVCLLSDPTVSVIEPETDISKIIETGASLYRLFLAES